MKTILLIDDNADFRGILKDIFREEKRNYKFIESSNPIDALETFYKNDKNIDIVLCDFFLPVQNGNEFLEIIKKNKPSIKCLLVSGDIQIKSRQYSYVDNVFSKLDLSELISYFKKLENTL